METRERIVEIVKSKGPVLPVQVSKEIGMNILMSSAHLAELTASQRLKISTIKVGGSPLYYLAGQEAMLQQFTSNMNDKEKKAYDLLSQNKILRDSEQEPVIRVALREIKDFAHPLNVKYNDNKEIFWKWYITTDEEAEKLIKTKLNILDEAEKKKEEKPIERKTESQKQREPPIEKQIIQREGIKKLEPLQKPAIDKQIKDIEKKEPRKYKPRTKEDIFLNAITRFFEKNKITIVNSEIVKKNSEIDFIIDIPSVVGNLQYYCKAKNKKRIGDSDLSGAYVKGQLRKLPVIVLSTGDLSTKAQEMLSKELNITFKKI